MKFVPLITWERQPLLSKKKKNILQGRNRAPQCSLQWWMLHGGEDGVNASRRCRVTEDRGRKMIVRTTNKLRMTNKLKHRTFHQLKLKKMKNTRGHISASSLPSNVKEATAMCCVNCADRKSTRLYSSSSCI